MCIPGHMKKYDECVVSYGLYAIPMVLEKRLI